MTRARCSDLVSRSLVVVGFTRRRCAGGDGDGRRMSSDVAMFVFGIVWCREYCLSLDEVLYGLVVYNARLFDSRCREQTPSDVRAVDRKEAAPD